MVWQYILRWRCCWKYNHLWIETWSSWLLYFLTVTFLFFQSEYYPGFLDSLSLRRSGGMKPIRESGSAPPVSPNVLFFNVHAAFTLPSNGKLCWSFHQVVPRRCCAPEENNPLWSQHLCSRSPAPSHGSSQIRSESAANRDGMFSLFTHQGFLLAWKDCLLIFNFILWKASVK